MPAPKVSELKPLPRKGAAHWARVHFEGDRRPALPVHPRFLAERLR